MSPLIIRALIGNNNKPEYNKKIFKILENKLLKGNKEFFRKERSIYGRYLYLAQFRLGLNLDYDSDSTLRQLVGIETESGHFKKIEIGYQRILDNLHLLDKMKL